MSTPRPQVKLANNVEHNRQEEASRGRGTSLVNSKSTQQNTFACACFHSLSLCLLQASNSDSDDEPQDWLNKAAKYNGKQNELAVLLCQKHATEQKLKVKLQAAKDQVQAAKDQLQAVTEHRDDLKTVMRKMEDDHVCRLAQSHAVLANRIVLEQALLRYGNGPTFTAQFSHFLENEIMKPTKKDNLRKSSLTSLDEISTQQSFSVAPAAIVKDLRCLVHNLCSPIHYNFQVVPGALNGICVGGQQPIATSLTLCMRKLQKLGFCESELIILNADFKPSMILTGGNISDVPASGAFHFDLVDLS